jgi:hypothetical protein
MIYLDFYCVVTDHVRSFLFVGLLTQSRKPVGRGHLAQVRLGVYEWFILSRRPVFDAAYEETGALTRTLRRGRGVLLPEQIELPRAFDGLGTAAGQQLGVDVVGV